MASHDQTPKRPVNAYQEFLDANLGGDFTQTMEERHAARVLEAIDFAEHGSYAEASASFLMASTTALTQTGKEYCETFAKATSDAHNAYESALANAASELKARERATALWNSFGKELAIYLNFLGVNFSERQKYSEAIHYYDQAIKINPTFAMSYFSRGGTKADLNRFDEAIQDIEIAVQLFRDQNDVTNHENAEKLLKTLKLSKSNFTNTKVKDSSNQKDPSKKSFDNYQQSISNAAHFKGFTIQVSRQFPKVPHHKQKELAAGLLFKYLEDKYDNKEQKYTELDIEFLKAICLQKGIDIEQYNSKKSYMKIFFAGFIVGGLILYVALKLLQFI